MQKFLLPAFLLTSKIIFSQNAGINTDGTAPESGTMLDVKGTNSIATNGTQNIFQVKSFDASAAALKLRLGLSTGASLYGTMDVYDANSSLPRTLVLQQYGGLVTIKTTTPLADLTLNGSFTTTSVSGANLHPGIWMNSSLNGNSGGCYGILSRGTLNAVANNDELIPFITSLGSAAPGAFTGVNFYGVKLDASTWTKASGTINTAMGLYVLAPSIGTNNYAASFTGGNVGISTTSPLAPLHIYSASGSDAYSTYGVSSAMNTDGLNLGYGGATWPGGGSSFFNAHSSTAADGKLRFMINWSEKMIITNDGYVGIGTISPLYRLHTYNTDPAVIINTYSQFYPVLSANQASNLHGGWSEIDANSAFNFNCTLFGAVNRVNVFAGQTGSVTSTVGSINDLYHYSSAAISTAYGSIHNIINTSTGTIANAYGLQAGILNSGGGTITNAYGVYISTMQGTNKWSVYASDAGANNYFAGNVGIGTTTTTYALNVTGDASVCGTVRYTSLSGACSDIRYKKDITPLNNSLNNILKLQGVNYFWKTKEFPQKHFSNDKQIGFIAQELEKIYPELVLTDKDGYKSVDYSRLTPILVEAIKDQQKLIDELNKKVAAMDAALKVAGIPTTTGTSEAKK